MNTKSKTKTKTKTDATAITDEQRGALLGLAGFILYSLRAQADAKPVSASYILSNIGHDVGGLLAQIAGEPGAQLFSPRTKNYAKEAQPLAPILAARFMLQDGLDWVSYTAKPGDEETDGRAKFKEFHGRAPRKGFYLFLCHPDTKWDGVGGYSVPRDGGFRPVRIL